MEITNTNGLLPLNLQFFADEGNGAAETSTDGAAGTPDAGEGKPASEQTPPDLNGLLAGDKTLQSQFDKLVSKAISTAVTNARGKWEQEKDMTPEQKADAEQQEKDRLFAEREQALLARELRAEALGMFGDKSLPAELIDCVNLSDAEAMKTSVAKAEKAFRAAVDKAVKEKLAGNPPAAGGKGATAHVAQVRQSMGLK